jgi:hypothetical protein
MRGSNLGVTPGTNPEYWVPVFANPVLQFVDYVTNTDHGFGEDRATLIEPVLDHLAEQADLCDVLYQKKDDTYEPRYASNGFAFFDTEPAGVMGAILSTCDGWSADNPDGSLALWVGNYAYWAAQPAASKVTITKDNVKDIQLDHGVDNEDLVNIFDWTYVRPDNLFKESPGDPWRDEADITARGKRRPVSKSLPWVQSHSQGRRLLKKNMLRTRAARGKLTTDLFGITALGERWIYLQDDRIAELEDAVLEINSVELDILRQELQFTFTIVDPATIDAFDADTEEGEEPPLPDDLVPVPLPIPDDVEAAAEGSAEGGVRLVVTFPAPWTTTRSDLTYAVRYRLQRPSTFSSPNAEPWIEQYVSDPTIDDSGVVMIATGLVELNQVYEAQAATVGPGKTYSGWSDTAEVSTAIDDVSPGVPTNFSAVLDGSSADLEWTNPNSANMYLTRIWRVIFGGGFGAATNIDTIFGAPSAVHTYTDTPGSGVWDYFVTAESAAGVSSAPVGPEQVVIP